MTKTAAATMTSLNLSISLPSIARSNATMFAGMLSSLPFLSPQREPF